jgi:hypothetical protein
MKKITLSFLAFAASLMIASAQAPAKFNYQGIARSATGAPLAAKNLGLRITIHDGTASGATVYQETQVTTTNSYGLYNVVIGNGTPTSGTMAGVNWGTGNKYVQVELDVNGGTAYTDLGATQLLSVPYAMYAAGATAPTLSLTGTTLSAGGNTVTLPTGATYTAGTGVSISGSNVISVNNLSGDVTGAPNATTVGKLQGVAVSTTAPTSGQTLTYNGTSWAPGTPSSYTAGTGISISSGAISVNNLAGDVSGAPNATTVGKIQGTSVSTTAPSSGQVLKYNGTAYAPAADNDAQSLSISGTTLSLTNGGSVTLPSTTYTAGTGISISGTTISANNTSNLWNANQLQGTGISTSAPSTGQALVYTSGAWTPTTLASGTVYTGGTGITVSSGGVISSNNLAGDVTGAPNANTVGKLQGVAVSSSAPSNGQFLKYTGSSWTPAADNDAQTLSVSGSSLSISGGNSVTLPTGSTYTAGTGISISGSIVISANNLGGDVTGAPNANTVTKIQGVTVSSTAPTSGQALVYNGTNWAPATTGSGSLSGTTNYVTKFTSSSGVGNSQIFDNGSTVAIGNSSPSSLNKLEVAGASVSTGVTAIRAGLGGVGTTGTGAPAAILGENLSTSSPGYGISGVTNNGGAGVYGQGNNGNALQGLVPGTGAAGFFDGGTTGTGIIVNSGRSGFGTATPKVQLDATNTAPVGDTIQIYTGIGGGPYSLATTAHIQNKLSSSTVEAASLVVRNTVGSAFANDGIISQVSGGSTGTYSGMFANCRTNGSGDAYGLLSFTGGSSASSGAVVGLYSYVDNLGSGVSFAGYFDGDVNITGSIAKSSGTFKIDHPLDPENKYLYHSFVESPDMMNIYNGNITTDGNGFATITMPSYFDALNKEFRYQLTVIGTFAQAIVKEEMQGNTFVIQTNQPNVKVSWQVTGIRHDKFAEAHRVQPEVEKESRFKGYYLNAKEWGQPESKSISNMLRPKQYQDKHSK